MARPPLRPALEILDRRDTPSANIEDVASLPHLPGMAADYPTDFAEITVAGRVGTPLRGEIHQPQLVVETVAVESRVEPPLKAQVRPRFAVTSAAGRPTTVSVYDGPTNSLVGDLTPFDRAFTGGARVATADITGDFVDDVVVAAGPGSAPWVQVYDGVTLAKVRGFLAYAETFTGGVAIAAGDIDGDGRADIVTGAGAMGGPHVKVFDGHDVTASTPPGDVTVPATRSFFAYEPDFLGGVTVAVADVNADGAADIVTGAGVGGGPRVRAFAGRNLEVLCDFFAFDPDSRVGVSVAAGDFGDGRVRVAAAELDGGHTVRLYDEGRLSREYTPFGQGTPAAGVAAHDLTGRGHSSLVVTTGRGAKPQVVVLDGLTGGVDHALPTLPAGYDDGLYVG